VGGLKYLLDTNVLAEPVATQPNPGVLDHIARNALSLAIAAVNWQEMLYGMYRMPKSNRRRQIEDYLFTRIQGIVPILAFDQAAAKWQARERVRLVGRGRTPPYADTQIAATAAVNRLILVTRNKQDFGDFQGVQVEDWFA
jgi:tRNA(fMet)-specific endonuclease VapC